MDSSEGSNDTMTEGTKKSAFFTIPLAFDTPSPEKSCKFLHKSYITTY